MDCHIVLFIVAYAFNCRFRITNHLGPRFGVVTKCLVARHLYQHTNPFACAHLFTRVDGKCLICLE
jgi:hypothetical protein